MKNMLFLMSLIALFTITFQPAMAQGGNALTINNPCNQYSVVASGCVGTCGVPGTLSYTVTPTNQRAVPLCLQNLSSSLCPNTGAFARVYVDGTLVASGNITAVGSTVSFVAQAGSTVKVLVTTFPINNGIQCVWLGNLNFGLKR